MDSSFATLMQFILGEAPDKTDIDAFAQFSAKLFNKGDKSNLKMHEGLNHPKVKVLNKRYKSFNKSFTCKSTREAFWLTLFHKKPVYFSIFLFSSVLIFAITSVMI